MMKSLKIAIAVIVLIMMSLFTACAAPDYEQDIISYSVDDKEEVVDYAAEVVDYVEEPVKTSEYVVKTVKTSEKKHEHGKIFSFQPRWSTAMSYVKPWCKSGECCYLGYSLFRGTPDDTSYLDVLGEYSDEGEIVEGKYYTITAIVSAADYDFNRTRISCKVQSEDIIVGFSVEFEDEFEEAVGLLDEGDEVTFRGRFYDEGCGFTDCELIEQRR